ncbi:hypothetical protein NKH18_04075 [Streptomyces sp. M10(2022)]
MRQCTVAGTGNGNGNGNGKRHRGLSSGSCSDGRWAAVLCGPADTGRPRQRPRCRGRLDAYGCSPSWRAVTS